MKKKEYVFEFIVGKEDFLNVLNSYPHRTSYSDNKFYYFDDFIVKITNDEIHFGVRRGGHSGGYWYIPSITECDERIRFCGIVKYIGPDADRGKIKKAIDGIEYFLLSILILPFALLVWLYMFGEWAIRKIIKRPKAKEKTAEENLYDLMENYLCCVRK